MVVAMSAKHLTPHQLDLHACPVMNTTHTHTHTDVAIRSDEHIDIVKYNRAMATYSKIS